MELCQNRQCCHLHFIAHSVDFLNVRENHFRVQPAVGNHGLHVISSQEIRNTGITSEIVDTVLCEMYLTLT